MALNLDSTVSFLDESQRSARGQGSGAQLVCAMDCANPLAPPTRFSLAGVATVELGRAPVRSLERSGEPGAEQLTIRVADAWMSSRHARLAFDDGRWVLEDLGSKNGTVVNAARVSRVVLSDGDVIALGNTIWLFRGHAEHDPDRPADFDATAFKDVPVGFATLNAALDKRLRTLARVAGSELAVLIGGETGTGKEVIARGIHELSGRKGRFVAVNCGALPPTLIEGELFGARKGAYSGAAEDRDGLVRAADGGTLFLDEIAELPPTSQAALLRVLQEREVRPVGDTRSYTVDLRVIAASHQQLDERVADERFRRDLFARLAGFRVELPPLRDRREDIGLLVASLLPRIGGGADTRFHRAAGAALFGYGWPRNIRELEHALRSAITLAQASTDTVTIALSHLPDALRDGDDGVAQGAAPERRAVGREELEALLREHGGNVSAVARVLATSRSHVRRLAARFGLAIDGYR